MQKLELNASKTIRKWDKKAASEVTITLGAIVGRTC